MASGLMSQGNPEHLNELARILARGYRRAMLRRRQKSSVSGKAEDFQRPVASLGNQSVHGGKKQAGDRRLEAVGEKGEGIFKLE